MLILSACKGPDEDIADVRSNLSKTGVSFIGKSFNGVWTVDKQVVDTARLEVTDVFRVRLPEVYLGAACFEKEYVSSAWPHHIEYKGQPSVIQFKDQGYTEYAIFNSLLLTEECYDGTTLFTHTSFVVAVDGVDHRVDVLSDEPGNAVYRSDNGQWAIGFTVTAFIVTNLETHEEQIRTPHKPIALYYNTKERIQ